MSLEFTNKDYNVQASKHFSTPVTKIRSETDQILLEVSLIDAIQSIIEYCNKEAFKSFKAQLTLEDCS